MKKLLIAVLATVITQQALAVNWIQVSEGIGDNKHYVDLDSIQADYLADGTPVITAWKQTEYKQAQVSFNGKKYWSDKSFYYYDCRARKFDIEYLVTYDKQGNVVSNNNNSSFSRYSSTNWRRVIPGTNGEITLNAVCAYAS